MARPAPSVDRVTAILDFLADHPTEGWSLSELARRLDLNKATAHSLLNALTDAGYLVRHPQRKDYSLGPALIRVGRAAVEQFPVVDFARPEMAALADDLGLEVLASAAVDDEMVILDRAGTPLPLGVSVAVGQRVPIVPPFGTAFVAWAGEAAIEAWLDRAPSTTTAGERARYREMLAVVRERGYSVALEADTHARIGQALADRSGGVEGLVDELGHEEYVLLELEPDRAYRVNHLLAPVFDADGQVAICLVLVGFRGTLAADRVVELADRLKASALTVTKSIHGSVPDT